MKMRKRRELPKDWDDDSLDTDKSRNSIHSVPSIFGVIIVLYISFLIGIVYKIDNTLPTALNITDEKNNPDAFISERAIHDLNFLTNLGPKVVGSYENEVLAVNFLKHEIEQIKLNAHPNQLLELDIQTVSGSYYMNLLKSDNINVYRNVQNIVVKLHGGNNTDKSILINSHFDSVPTSPGGSDDGINVVAMLEILRKISKFPYKPRHNVIFLFNGAEETVLQASHGFITQHKWAKGCKIVVNLEAAGTGGKIMLFQTGPGAPWLLEAYKQVPHPVGAVIGEEIFQSGWIPSDTDFRIFRDFGELVGLDMAFCRHGYRYHTKYDDFKNIPFGSYQHVGDNALKLINVLANAPELNKLQTGQHVVYYDILGWFMVTYSDTTSTILNSGVIFMSLFVTIWSLFSFKLSLNTLPYICFVLGSILGGWVLALSFSAILSYVLDVLNHTMSWYGTPVLVIGLFSIPTVAITAQLMTFVSHEKLSLNVRLQIQAHSVRLIWTVVLFIGTIFKIRSVYPITISVAFNTLAFLIIHSLRLHRSVRKWQILYLTCLFIPTIFLIYESLTGLEFFIPLTGRIGSDKNPDLIIGSLTVLLTILTTSNYVILSNILRQGKYFFILLWFIFLATLVVVFTPLGFPYSGDWVNPTPQRYWMTHSQRLFYNETGHLQKTDSGIFMLNMDRNSPNSVKSYVKDLSKAKSLKDDCNNYILCGLPLSHVKMTQIMEYSTWVPANQPNLPFPSKLIVNSKKMISSTSTTYNISLTGPDRQYVFLVPKENVNLTKLSLIDKLPKFVNRFKGRPLIFLNTVSGVNPATLTVTFDVEYPENYTGDSYLDVAVSSVHVHSKLVAKTPYYTTFLKQFPDWADVTAWVGSYASYVL
ncbi:endoplasmic reticulum metallopeptidase 1-like [Diorhabda carinulata]|uniref:endoplasmic reticulum metallopeptidase 1-like n=1 Tax=Diorhabda carinulata TaxID=1163345 RepID=UPI0025A1229A|nr:endoplasmic reticulum metallopeptidase 1-like [Diorhabda carinulata]